MGMYQYIIQVSKPNLRKRKYTVCELNDFIMVKATDFEEHIDLYEDIKPYTVKRNVLCMVRDAAVQTIPHYIWHEKEIVYWHENYDVFNWLGENITRDIDIGGFNKLDKTIIKNLNDKFGANIPEESETKKSAMFYMECY